MGDKAQSDENKIFTVRIVIFGVFTWLGAVLQPIVTDALRSLLRGERIEAFISGLLLGGAIVFLVTILMKRVVNSRHAPHQITLGGGVVLMDLIKRYWEERGEFIGGIVLALSLGFLLAIIVNPSSVDSALWAVSVAFLLILVLIIQTRLLTTPS